MANMVLDVLFFLQTDHSLTIIKPHHLLGDYCLEWTYNQLFISIYDKSG